MFDKVRIRLVCMYAMQLVVTFMQASTYIHLAVYIHRSNRSHTHTVNSLRLALSLTDLCAACYLDNVPRINKFQEEQHFGSHH